MISKYLGDTGFRVHRVCINDMKQAIMRDTLPSIGGKGFLGRMIKDRRSGLKDMHDSERAITRRYVDLCALASWMR